MEVSFRLYPEDVREQVYQSKPGITGIGSLIFRDEEKIISEAADPRSMYAAIYPYKGALELWYKRNASLGTDFKIIFLTAWSILFPKNNLTYRLIKNLPPRPF
jgi:lipopolysaccharide/colanic/teichoic acid biosynthesis glycosyltransferase